MGKGCPEPAIYAVSQLQRNQEAGLGRQRSLPAHLGDVISWEPGRAILADSTHLFAPKYFGSIGGGLQTFHARITHGVKEKQRSYKPEIIDAEIVEEPVWGDSLKWGEQWCMEAKIKKAPSSSCSNCGAVQKEMKNSRLVCAYCGG